MQTGQFSNGDKYAHKVYLSGSKRKFSVWYSAAREYQNAAAIDALGDVEMIARQFLRATL